MNDPIVFPHGGERRFFSDFAVFLGEKALVEPDVDVVPGQPRGDRDGAEVDRRVDAERLEAPRVHTSSFSCSSHESKRAPLRQACSMTSASERSPRAKTPSRTLSSTPCVLRSTRAARASACEHALLSIEIVRRVHRAPLERACAASGRALETLTVTLARVRLAACLPHAERRARRCATIPRTSSSSSVGRPIMK